MKEYLVAAVYGSFVGGVIGTIYATRMQGFRKNTKWMSTGDLPLPEPIKIYVLKEKILVIFAFTVLTIIYDWFLLTRIQNQTPKN